MTELLKLPILNNLSLKSDHNQHTFFFFLRNRENSFNSCNLFC